MARLKTYLLAVATVLMALAIGYFMQQGDAATPVALNQKGDLVVSDITDMSSASGVAPRLPVPAALETASTLPDLPVQRVRAEAPLATIPTPDTARSEGFDCAIEMSAEVNAGAMVALELSAPCYASERVTIHHHGLMFTEHTAPDGSLRLSVPALTERALFVAAFDGGDGATAVVDVPALPFYDRVVLQWRGASGLQLHAREFGADYFTDGHIWSAHAGDMTRSAQGESGFLTRLGDASGRDPLVAEIYSFPAGTARQEGTVSISVEAEVTDANCDRAVEAQTLERHGDAPLRVRDLSLSIPACDGVGDFLVLKNLVEDLKIAAR